MGFGINASILGAKNREMELEVLANNIANVQTTGFKEMHIAFNSELTKAQSDDVIKDAASYGRDVQHAFNWERGSLYRTDNPLDVAIQSAGFFEVQTQEGTRYTRSGSFALSSEGMLVTQQGFPIMTESGTVTVGPGQMITVNGEGQVMADGQQLGKLRIVDFEDKKGLKLEGRNLFSAEGLAPKVLDRPVLSQGYLESSNVNMVRNLTRIIEVSRAYESHQKSMQKQFDASQILNQISKMG